MGSKRSNIIAATTIISLIILIIVLRVTVGLSETFFLILGASVAAILGIIAWIVLQYRAERSFQRKMISEGRELRLDYSFLRKVAKVPTKFQYKDLETATDNFQSLLGRGSSAAVFKGILNDGTPIAVKRISGVEHGEKEFKSEVAAIASVQHVNLVQLLGYCSVPGGPRLLVYQFVSNGSLGTWIFPRRANTNSVVVQSQPSQCLPWDLRYRVAIDVAKALAYLHHDCRARVLHLDVKPENILLDENFRAVVTDFGLSSLMGRDVSRIFTSTTRGTEGYLAPEWLLGNGISEKSDIYSYGMVLLELVGGRRNVRLLQQDGDSDSDRKWSYFPKIVIEKLKEGKLMEVVDERLLVEGSKVDERRIMILVHVALWCIQENPKLRPNMSRVVDMLEEHFTVDIPPEPGMTLLDLLEAPGNGVETAAAHHIENQPACSYSFTLSVLSGR